MTTKRAKGGAFGGGKFADADGKREPGKFKKFDTAATVAKLGTKTKSDGFKAGGSTPKRKDGGSIPGRAPAATLAKRARGGSAPFSCAASMSDRSGTSASGHEGE